MQGQAAEKSIPETRHPRQTTAAQRQRRHAHHAPQCLQTMESLSNLQSFLVNTAPCFPAASNQVSTSEGPRDSHFNLDELWKAYDAWSAYGAEVPLAVPAENASQVTQCYVPYLSGLQLFEHSPVRRLHHCSYTSDEDFPDSLNSDLTSVGSSMETVYTDSDSEDGKCHATGTQDRFSVLRKGTALGDPSRLLFEFFETTSPHEREPFTDRIQQLAASCCPELLTLSSSSLHPSSWYSVAWYPLYRFPSNGSNIRELNASFLTFHSISAPPNPQSPRSLETRPQAPVIPQPAQHALTLRQHALASEHACDAVTLEAFAFMPYKLQGAMWADPLHNKSVYGPMMAAAQAWVERRKCTHPDLCFFADRIQPLPTLPW